MCDGIPATDQRFPGRPGHIGGANPKTGYDGFVSCGDAEGRLRGCGHRIPQTLLGKRKGSHPRAALHAPPLKYR